MIKWHNNLLVHESIENIEEVKLQIENKTNSTRVFCIIDALTPSNLFEIVSGIELSSNQYNEYYDDLEKDIVIYAIAKGKNNIKEMLVSLIENIINEEGVIDKSLLHKLGGD